MRRISIVIPVFNEAPSLAELQREIRAVESANDLEIEIVMVDDGSSDESWKTIVALAQSDPRLFGIQLRRNFGKAAALSAGIAQSNYELVMTMDADLQDDPAEIPKFLAAAAEGAECISGWKKIRHDPWHKTLPSRLFNWGVSCLTGVQLHDHNCGFKLYHRAIFDEVDLYGERHRFIPVLAAAQGWRVSEVVVAHRPRKYGHSKYGWGRLPKGFLDLFTVYFLTGFRHRPQHLLGSIGIGSFLIGALGLVVMSIYWSIRMYRIAKGWDVENWAPLHERPIVIYSLGALLLGAQLISLGFLAELITSLHRPQRPSFSIRQTTRAHRIQSSKEPTSPSPDDHR